MTSDTTNLTANHWIDDVRYQSDNHILFITKQMGYSVERHNGSLKITSKSDAGKIMSETIIEFKKIKTVDFSYQDSSITINHNSEVFKMESLSGGDFHQIRRQINFGFEEIAINRNL